MSNFISLRDSIFNKNEIFLSVSVFLPILNAIISTYDTVIDLLKTNSLVKNSMLLTAALFLLITYIEISQYAL